MSAILISILRTFIPYVWGWLVTQLVLAIPALSPWQDALLGQSEGITVFLLGVVTTAVATAWYAVSRWLEPRLPNWAVRIILGSALRPQYEAETVPGGFPKAGLEEDGVGQ